MAGQVNREELQDAINTLSDLRSSLDELTSVLGKIVNDIDEQLFSLTIEIKKLLDK